LFAGGTANAGFVYRFVIIYVIRFVKVQKGRGLTEIRDFYRYQRAIAA
jgi:hypothetical protein